MSDSSPAYGPIGGWVLFFLIRALVGQKPRRGSQAPSATVRPSRPAATTSVRPSRSPLQPLLPLAPPAPRQGGAYGTLTIPVAHWTQPRELLAWRAWGLGVWPGEAGPRLTSLGVRWVWSGPVLRADFRPHGSLANRSGIHAMKARYYGQIDWVWSEFCWVTGWVALSGRVVEHELGYRAERAAIRKLRLGLGIHLVEQRIPALLRIARQLEDHYQAPVKLGGVERRIAQAMLRGGFQPRVRTFYDCQPRGGWRVG